MTIEDFIRIMEESLIQDSTPLSSKIKEMSVEQIAIHAVYREAQRAFCEKVKGKLRGMSK